MYLELKFKIKDGKENSYENGLRDERIPCESKEVLRKLPVQES